jgi:hypothetical protein
MYFPFKKISLPTVVVLQSTQHAARDVSHQQRRHVAKAVIRTIGRLRSAPTLCQGARTTAATWPPTTSGGAEIYRFGTAWPSLQHGWRWRCSAALQRSAGQISCTYSDVCFAASMRARCVQGSVGPEVGRCPVQIFALSPPMPRCLPRRTTTVGSEIFLKGKYIEIGIHSTASYGTAYVANRCSARAVLCSSSVACRSARRAGVPSGFNGATYASYSWSYNGGIGFIAGARSDRSGRGLASGCCATERQIWWRCGVCRLRQEWLQLLCVPVLQRRLLLAWFSSRGLER